MTLALLLNPDVRGIAFYRKIFFLPSIVPTVATSAIFVRILNPQIGLVNSLLDAVGIRGPAWLPPGDAVAHAPVYEEYIRPHPQFATFVRAVSSPNVQAQPPVAYQVFVNDSVGKIEDEALHGEISPDQAMEKLKSSVDKEFSRRKRLGFDE